MKKNKILLGKFFDALLLNPYIHPILFAAFPTISMYQYNMNETWIDFTFLPLVLSLIFLIASWLFFLLIFRDQIKASLASSLWVIIFFSYGHFHSSFSRLFIEKSIYKFYPAGPHSILLVINFLILGAFFVFIFRRKEVLTPTKLFNFIAIILVSYNLISIIPYEVNKFISLKEVEKYVSENEEIQIAKNNNSEEYPNIYYFIFDRYSSQQVLSKYFNYDNSNLLEFLEQRNFYNIKDSLANYPETYLSLSSSLNMSYLNYLEKITNNETVARIVLYSKLIQENSVERFLKDKGYENVFVGSSYTGTKHSAVADRNYNKFENYNGILYFIYENSLANVLLEKFLSKKFSSYAYFVDSRVTNLIYRIDNIVKESLSKKPIFLFAHFILPHPPNLLTSNCDFVGFYTPPTTEDRGYLDQLECANKTIKTLVDKISQNAQRPYVIIIQSDEGAADKALEYENNEKYQIHAPVINFIYMSPKSPDEKIDYVKVGLNDSLTPVNTFRIIFNYYFGTDFKILEDKTYVKEEKDNLFHFKDITNIVAE